MVTAHRIPLDELRRRACAELATNPTIVSYEWGYPDGYYGGECLGLINWTEHIQAVVNRTLEMLSDVIGIDIRRMP